MRKPRLVSLLAAAVCAAGIFGAAACNTEKPSTPDQHNHSWGAWTVASVPTQTEHGKASRTCSGSGECDATAADKEYTLPVLTSTDYSATEDNATCTTAGTVTYTYNKNGVNVNFEVATPVNATAHNYGSFTYKDGAGHYRICSHNPVHTTTVEDHDTDGDNGACSVCGYKATPIPHTHTPGTWVNTDSEQHYKLCTDSNCDNPTEKLEAGAHNTNGTNGACSVCGYKAAPITHTHTPGTWINTDSEQHYKLCTDSNCDNPTEKLEAGSHLSLIHI